MTDINTTDDQIVPEAALRAALAANVNGATPIPAFDQAAEDAVNESLTACQRELVALRHQKQVLADRIRDLVAQEERLIRVANSLARSRKLTEATPAAVEEA